MNEIKAGHGYRSGRPIGVESGPCQNENCDGTIITLRINTDIKGFETSTEKVCNICGRIYPMSSQIIGKPPIKYEMNKWNTHNEWKTAMMQSQKGPDIDEGIDNHLEASCNYNGDRPNKKDLEGVYFSFNSRYVNKNYENELKVIEKRLNNTNASKNVPRDITRLNNYFEIVEDYTHKWGMMKFQEEDAKFIIKNEGNGLSKIDRAMEDIILCVCLYVMSKSVSNGRMAVLKRQTPMWNEQYKTLYGLIRDKLNS
jgi:hypothetical protein